MQTATVTTQPAKQPSRQPSVEAAALKREDIERIYITEKNSLRDTAGRLQTSTVQLAAAMFKFGISPRRRGPAGIELTKEAIEAAYAAAPNQQAAAEALGVSLPALRKAFADHKVPVKSRRQGEHVKLPLDPAERVAILQPLLDAAKAALPKPEKRTQPKSGTGSKSKQPSKQPAKQPAKAA